jgi:hypothetical protein
VNGAPRDPVRCHLPGTTISMGRKMQTNDASQKDAHALGC